MKNQIVDTIIIGAGASGLMLGALLKNRDFLIIEHNSKVGSKILISGGGRCNITNNNLQPKNYLGNQRFIRNIIKRFDQNQLLLWLNQRGLTPQLRKNSQYFCKNSAKEIVDLLKKEIDKHKIKLQTKVIKIEKKNNIFKIYSNRGIFQAKKVVVA
ncbi:MAG: NAD(P)/FAD-dependent oxidoreductase, partial [Sulfurovaceae bacterium]|nr:NAD(P)/FAD-dependent oxidoreductase [Sulfurovaceae bacterium]